MQQGSTARQRLSKILFFPSSTRVLRKSEGRGCFGYRDAPSNEIESWRGLHSKWLILRRLFVPQTYFPKPLELPSAFGPLCFPGPPPTNGPNRTPIDPKSFPQIFR